MQTFLVTFETLKVGNILDIHFHLMDHWQCFMNYRERRRGSPLLPPQTRTRTHQPCHQAPIRRKLLNTVNNREKLTFIVYRFTVHPLVIRICISRIFYPPSSQPQQTTGDISLKSPSMHPLSLCCVSCLECLVPN